MALTLSGTNGVVGAGFTVDASGVSVTAGVGTFSSIGAGASVPAVGLTGSLPTISAANCTNIPAANITGTLPAISGANLTGISAGMTMHDVWAITAGVDPAGGSNDLTANWARSNAYFGTIGSAMTESSGVFTFPSTGIYYIQIAGGFYRTSSDSHGYTGFNIMTATDGSSFSNQQGMYSNIPGLSGTTYSYCATSYTFDVTNTSTHKVMFQTVVHGSGTSLLESANSRRLNVEFTRLGDT